MGTLLMESGIPAAACFEELCLSRPELVSSIHASYLAAGARLIRTNSFGANAVRLARKGLEKQVNEINWAAAQIARQCARGNEVHVAGSVGPLGVNAAQARARGINREAVFREQLGALLDGGVQVIFFETFTEVDELALALYVKQSLHHCPAICSLATSDDGFLPSGASLGDALNQLQDLGADLIGVNCVNGPETALHLCGQFPGIHSAYPSAGLPHAKNGRLVYDIAPDSFARAVSGLAQLGVRLIGGCCGTGPAHIAAMNEVLNSLPLPPDF
jgi:homocysteine S-methyltransferase